MHYLVSAVGEAVGQTIVKVVELHLWVIVWVSLQSSLLCSLPRYVSNASFSLKHNACRYPLFCGICDVLEPIIMC